MTTSQLIEEFRKAYLRTMTGPNVEERAERLAKERVKF